MIPRIGETTIQRIITIRRCGEVEFESLKERGSGLAGIN
jgi:predicted DNA-binding helix-hairpin-helix protein